MTSDDINKGLFFELVAMFGTSALQQMGKMVNPITRTAETNLEAAQTTIDLLDVLEQKTKGNLDREEESFLKNTISSLKLTYVETAHSAPATEAPKTVASPAGEPEITGVKPGEKADDKQPKFHKKY